MLTPSSAHATSIASATVRTEPPRLIVRPTAGGGLVLPCSWRFFIRLRRQGRRVLPQQLLVQPNNCSSGDEALSVADHDRYLPICYPRPRSRGLPNIPAAVSILQRFLPNASPHRLSHSAELRDRLHALKKVDCSMLSVRTEKVLPNEPRTMGSSSAYLFSVPSLLGSTLRRLAGALAVSPDEL